jgi:hypothetical protein
MTNELRGLAMATVPNPGVPTNGQPAAVPAVAAKPAGPPLVQFHSPAELGEAGLTDWRKLLPSLGVSAGVHLLLVLVFLLGRSGFATSAAAPEDQVLETRIEESTQQPPNFENTDVGFNEPDKPLNFPVNRIDANSVPGQVRPDEPIGIEGAPAGPPQNVPPPVGFGEAGTGAGLAGNVPGTGAMLGDPGGYANALRNMPGMAFAGRSGATREKVAMAQGGNTASEAAVARGLVWLQRQQKSNGNWVIDGNAKDDVAATGLALLPFLAAGETHKPAPGAKESRYTRTVESGLKYLLGKQRANGDFSGKRDTYGHALATMALCEAYGMTGDPTLKRSAQLALDYVVKAQHQAGGWRYDPNTPGDTSVTGWCLQALKSGYLAGLSVPRESMSKVNTFLDSVQSRNGTSYGYTTAEDPRPSLNAVGLLCRQYLGWGPKNPQLIAGVEQLKRSPPSKGQSDIYYYYYATQVVQLYGGPDWTEFWNPRMRDLLIDTQDKGQGPTGGSFPPERNTFTGRGGGRLATTCLSLLTLEVYYRYSALFKAEAKAPEL